MPHGASARSSSASSSPRSAPDTIASTRSTGWSSSGVSTASAWARTRARNSSTRSRLMRQPGGGAVAAVALEVPAAACSAPSRSKPGMLRPEPVPELAVERDQDRRAVVALDDPRGHDPDHAGVPAVGGQHVRAALAHLARPGPRASHRIRCSTARRSVLTASSSAAISCGTLRVVGQQQLEPGVGAAQPAGGVDPRRQPEAEREVSSALGSARETRISARRPGLAVPASAPARRARAGGSRRAAASGRRPSPAPRARGPRRRCGAPSASASLCATAVPHRSAHG